MYAQKPRSDEKKKQDTPLANSQISNKKQGQNVTAPLAGKAHTSNLGLGVTQPKVMPFWAMAYSKSSRTQAALPVDHESNDSASSAVQLQKKLTATLPTQNHAKPSALGGAQAAAMALSRGSPVKSLLGGIATLSVAYLAPEVVKSVIQAVDDEPSPHCQTEYSKMEKHS